MLIIAAVASTPLAAKLWKRLPESPGWRSSPFCCWQGWSSPPPTWWTPPTTLPLLPILTQEASHDKEILHLPLRPVLRLSRVFLVANAVSPDRTFSQMENRNLEQLPVPSVKTLLNGQFMKDFETYTTDQFVGRDGWIALKSTTERVLGKKENNNVYFAAGDT